MNKRVYLGLLTIELNKTVMEESWYDYMQPNYEKKAKRFIEYVKTDDNNSLQKTLKQSLTLQIMYWKGQ